MAENPMTVLHVRPEDHLRITQPGGEVTEWVRAEDFAVVQGQAHDLRRTVALAHMLMSFGDWGPALRKIENDTGLRLDDARAMRGILASVQEHGLSLSSGPQEES